MRAERFNLAVPRPGKPWRRGELERARQMLAHLNKNFANEPGAPEVLPRLRERLEGLLGKRDASAFGLMRWATVVQQVRSLRDAGDVRGALAAIEEGRKRLGEQTALMELAREIEAGTMSRRQCRRGPRR